MDRSSGEQGAGARVVLESPDGEEISYAVILEFKTTNNQAEYKALIAGLKLAQAVQTNKLKIWKKSQLVVDHINEKFLPKDEKMEQYLRKFKHMIEKFKSVDIVQIPRSKNYHAHILAKIAAKTDQKMPKLVPMEVKSFPSIEQNLKVIRIKKKGSWMDPIV